MAFSNFSSTSTYFPLFNDSPFAVTLLLLQLSPRSNLVPFSWSRHMSSPLLLLMFLPFRSALLPLLLCTSVTFPRSFTDWRSRRWEAVEGGISDSWFKSHGIDSWLLFILRLKHFIKCMHVWYIIIVHKKYPYGPMHETTHPTSISKVRYAYIGVRSMTFCTYLIYLLTLHISCLLIWFTCKFEYFRDTAKHCNSRTCCRSWNFHLY